ncbi:MAG: hypothetical protein ACE5OR_00305 [bacterium]
MAKRKDPDVRKEDPRIAQQLQGATLALQQIANSLGYMVLQMSDLKDKNNSEKMPMLTSLGFDRKAIAAILRTTPETVSVTLSKMKARTEGRKAGKAAKAEGKGKAQASD